MCLIYNLTDTVVCLAGARSLLRPEKKVLVVCLAGVQSLLWPEKKVLVICLAGAQSLLRPEKKSSSRLSGGCAIVKYYDRKKKSIRLLGPAGSFSSEFAPLHPHLSVDQKSNDEKITWFDSLFIQEIDMGELQFEKLWAIRYRTDSHIEVQIRILFKDK